MRYVVVKTRDDFGAKLISKLARQLKANSKILSMEEAEDWLLGKMIGDEKFSDEEVSRKDIARHFAKYGIKI